MAEAAQGLNIAQIYVKQIINLLILKHHRLAGGTWPVGISSKQEVLVGAIFVLSLCFAKAGGCQDVLLFHIGLFFFFFSTWDGAPSSCFTSDVLHSANISWRRRCTHLLPSLGFAATAQGMPPDHLALEARLSWSMHPGRKKNFPA